MPNRHAILSASASHRWLSCTPSARLELEFENKESQVALEGTAAHTLAEHKLKMALGLNSTRPISSFDGEEMEECTDDYVTYIMELYAKAQETCDDPMVLVEHHLDLSDYVPDSFGTCDCIIASDGVLHIVDLKYGTGIVVDAKDNSQMKLYGLGALRLFDSLYNINEVSMTIFQPRRENISTWVISVDELKRWAKTELKEKAMLAYKGEGDFNNGPWCTFCRASPKCRKRAEAKLRIAQDEFKLPPTLTDDEIEEILTILPDITKWAEEINTYALDMAINHGKVWKGFKVVEGRSVRKYKDEQAVAEAAMDAGFNDIYRRSLITLTEMQKLMGKNKFEEVLGNLIYKPSGKPTLVPITDKRVEMNISNVLNDFIAM